MVSLALDPDLLKQVDEWLANQTFPTTKTAVFEIALRDFLKTYGDGTAPDQKPQRQRGKKPGRKIAGFRPRGAWVQFGRTFRMFRTCSRTQAALSAPCKRPRFLVEHMPASGA